MPDSSLKNTILIVDDTPTNLEVLHEVLNNHGYEVLVAVDGESALNQAAYARPDIILLDVMMPGVDGFETCRRLKENEATQKIPVMFMTALSDTEDKVRGFDLGAVDYITKPLQHQEVLARIHTHLMLRQLQRQLETANEDLEKRVEERTAELTRLNAAYEKFVPREFIKFLNKNTILDIRLGDQIQSEMTVFFSDVQGWTAISESKSPQENFDFLNNYFSLVSPIIREHHGFVDQYYGDGVMALFPKYPDDSIAAAIAIQRRIREYNEESRAREIGTFKIGIGMHTGSLMLGIVGEDERMQGAVVSDGVNLAARLEGLTRVYGSSIMISEQTLGQLRHKHRYHYRLVGKVRVKGKKNTVTVYEICDGDSEETIQLKLKTKHTFEEGLRLYHQRKFAESSVKFNKVIEMNPKDRAARLYLDRSAGHLVQGVPEDWQGVVTVGEN